MRYSVWLTRVGLALLVAASIDALAATSAQAASTGVASVVETTKVNYKAAKGKQNKVVVTLAGRTITIDDTVAIKAGKGCKEVKGDKTKVRCTTRTAPTRVRVYTYDRNDSITNKASLPSTLNGGTGSDTIVGGPRADLINGDNGNDKIWGAGGNDTIYPDLGNDVSHGGDGADLIMDVGGKFVSNDWMYGDNGDDTAFGFAGSDHIFGGFGDDFLSGGADADYIDGGYGGDYLIGNDCLAGDPVGNCTAKDTLIGGPGINTIVTSSH
ncbi:calcium-binding protein [Actinoplanes sp. NPDC026619]|uniref:calcium-binding protein n=1 Tax=Actinoplanes sp. NPDC026619 TaxID=3155798 RepID=UPI0033C08418